MDYFERVTNPYWQVQPSTETSIFALAGVPTDFADTGEIAYMRKADPALADRYCIRPTCEVDGSFVLPPVRLRAFSEATEDDPFLNVQLLSACEQDYGPAMDRVADAIARHVSPGCFPGCARDVDPDAPGLQVDCVVRISIPLEDGSTHGELPRCEEGPEGALLPPGDDPGCWFPRTGPDLHERAPSRT